MNERRREDAAADACQAAKHLAPPQRANELGKDTRIAEGVRWEWLTAPLMAQTGPPPSTPHREPLADLLRELAADREER